MPKKPKRQCKKPGCPNLHDNPNGFCDEHQLKKKTKETKDDRLPSSQRGYDYKWKKFRDKMLKKYPTCVRCGAPAEVIDHKIPYPIMEDIYGGNTYKEEHYQPLCKRCNDLKGRREDKPMIESYFNNHNKNPKERPGKGFPGPGYQTEGWG